MQFGLFGRSDHFALDHLNSAVSLYVARIIAVLGGLENPDPSERLEAWIRGDTCRIELNFLSQLHNARTLYMIDNTLK
jgi:hypothetical protein